MPGASLCVTAIVSLNRAHLLAPSPAFFVPCLEGGDPHPYAPYVRFEPITQRYVMINVPSTRTTPTWLAERAHADDRAVLILDHSTHQGTDVLSYSRGMGGTALAC